MDAYCIFSPDGNEGVFLSLGFEWGTLRMAESFRYLVHPLLRKEPIPSVPRVNCSSCRRVREKLASWEVKCCDVTPQFPNFLVGEILSHGSHPVLESWIETRRGDPYFLLVPPSTAKAHLDARQDGKFGLACPILLPEQGECSVYWARPALCIGYHCYYPSALWQEGMSCLTSYLRLLQDSAAKYFVSSWDFDLQLIAQVWEKIEDEEQLWEGESQNASMYQSFWQSWAGKEQLFYLHCYELLCKRPTFIWSELRQLHRQMLVDRLAREGHLTKERERFLFAESQTTEELAAVPPLQEARKKWRQGTIPPEQNSMTILEHEQSLLWYLKQMNRTTVWSWLRHRLKMKEVEHPEQK